MRNAVVLIVVLAGASACKKDSKSSEGATKGGAPGAQAVETAAPPPVPAGATRITAPQFVVDVVAPSDCKAGAPCEVSVQLHALGEFHVNRDYPHKFVPADGAVVTTAPAKMDIASGDRAGTMTLAFEAPAAGTAKVSGNFKLSVCSAENCVIQEPVIAASIPVI